MGWRCYIRVMGNEPCCIEMGAEQSTGASTHCGERRSDAEELALQSSSIGPHSLAFASSQPAESIHTAVGSETHTIDSPADFRLPFGYWHGSHEAETKRWVHTEPFDPHDNGSPRAHRVLCWIQFVVHSPFPHEPRSLKTVHFTGE